MTQHPAPWWYRLLARLFPGRCREIPEANNPTWPDGTPRIVLRQFAIVKNRRELQLAALLHVASSSGWREQFWRAVLWCSCLCNVYLQQFACDEDSQFMHSHPYRRMLAIGLWGGYLERRIAGGVRRRSSPYLYALDAGHVHHVQDVTAGHTSIFAGFGRALDGSEGDKRYFGTPTTEPKFSPDGWESHPSTRAQLWSEHIRVKVARI